MKKFTAWILLGLAGVYALVGFLPHRYQGNKDIARFARLPILEGGRIKPFDSLARNSLLLLSGKQSVRFEGKKLSASEWLLDMMYKPEVAAAYPVFAIDDPDVRGLLGIPPSSVRRFPFTQFSRFLDEIDRQAQAADQVPAEKRNRFQRSVLGLFNKVSLYQRLQNTLQIAGEEGVYEQLKLDEKSIVAELQNHAQSGTAMKPSSNINLFFNRGQMLMQSAAFYPVPLGHTEKMEEVWVSIGEALLHGASHGNISPVVHDYSQLSSSYQKDDSAAFNQMLVILTNDLKGAFPKSVRRASYEYAFNDFSPFLRSMTLYVVVFLLAALSWLLKDASWQKAAFWGLAAAFAIHTVGLVARMVLQGRPPVTNLYSSAIFVGWAAVLMSLVMERLFRNGIGSAVGAFIGFVTLIVAHHLATQGDTMEMMRAVLDSNFWLATHVVTITIGYSSTFLSGFIAAVYLVRRSFDRSWNAALGDNLAKMVYGVVCFNALFAFVGTVLGGIWADQSWGRFWGWDPKENGALMIVLWNALVLHVWYGRLAKQKTIMALAVFGNIVTALSWFGVNMLGIGLHSYGFMDKAFIWLVVFTVSQFALMGLALLREKSRGTTNISLS